MANTRCVVMNILMLITHGMQKPVIMQEIRLFVPACKSVLSIRPPVVWGLCFARIFTMVNFILILKLDILCYAKMCIMHMGS